MGKNLIKEFDEHFATRAQDDWFSEWTVVPTPDEVRSFIVHALKQVHDRLDEYKCGEHRKLKSFLRETLKTNT